MTTANEQTFNQAWTSIEDRRRQLRRWDEVLRTPQDVHILGGGVAALAAAIEILSLERPGRRRHSVTIHEGSDRLGGRINTKRLGPEPPAGTPDTRPYFERGAMRIPTSHDYTWTFAREVGLSRRRFLNDDRTYDFGGKVYRPADIRALAREVYRVELRPGEGPGSLYAQKVLNPEMSALDAEHGGREVWARRLVDGEIRGSGLERIDRLTLDAVLTQRLAANEKAFVAALLFPGLLDRAFLMFVRSAITNQGDLYELCRREGEAIVGGMDLLVKGMAEKIRAVDPTVLRLNRKVRSIVTNPGGEWVVTFDDGETLVRGGRPDRHLLCTLPFAVVQHGDVELEGFESPFLEAVQKISYAHATKVAVHVKERFWEPRIKGGRSLTDRPITSSYFPNDHSQIVPIEEDLKTATHAPYDLYSQPLRTLEEGEAAGLDQQPVKSGPWLMLSSYTFGERARVIGTRPPLSTVADLRRVFPEVERLVVEEGSETWYWNEKPFSRGPFVLPIPGNVSQYYQRARAPQWRVFFAGDHLSPDPGWIQGSLFSSLYALNQILMTAAGGGEEAA